MKPVRTRLGAALAAMTLGASALAVMGGTANALSNPPSPQLTFDHTISSHPFSGAPGNAIDIEGLAAVSASSMWVADDNSDSLWQIDPASSPSGAYISRLRGGATKDVNGQPLAAYPDFASATEVGSGLTCGQLLNPAVVGDTAANECLSRTDDFESVVYDGSGAIYAISGIAPSQTLAGTPANPTVWKLTNTGSGYTPTSFQQLPQTEDATAAGWRPGTGLYFGKGTKLKTYDFPGNTLGSTFSIGLSDIVGVTFPDANTAFVTTARVDTSAGRTTATSDSTIRKFTVSGSTFTQATTWTFPLASIGNAALGVDNAGMIDARDLAIVGDTFYVSDGYDGRASGDHPIYVYTLGTLPPPIASFTAIPTSGRAPFNVQFTDTSTPLAPAAGAPTSWDWNFGDGTAHSTLQSPLHAYTAAGTYTATLIATNAAGPSVPASQMITVDPALPPPPPTGTGSWHNWEPLGGSMTSGPASSSWGPGRIDTFARGGDGNLWHQAFAGQWYGWEPLGKPSAGFTGDPAAVSWGSGRIDVFVRGTDNHLWHRAYAGQWSAWEDLGGTLASSPAVASMNAGRLDVFAKAADGQLQHSYFTGTTWSSWEPLGGGLYSDPGAVSWGPNRIDVFARGSDSQLWHKFFGGSSWSAWEPLGGGLGSGPGVSSWGPNHLDIFVVGSGGGLWQKTFDGKWHSWKSLGGNPTADPDAVSWSWNRIDVFARGGDNQLWHRAYA